jgi:hypothetical protein
MKSLPSLLLFVAATTFLSAGCSTENPGPVNRGPIPSEESTGPATAPTEPQVDSKEMFDGYCGGCHEGGSMMGDETTIPERMLEKSGLERGVDDDIIAEITIYMRER